MCVYVYMCVFIRVHTYIHIHTYMIRGLLWTMLEPRTTLSLFVSDVDRRPGRVAAGRRRVGLGVAGEAWFGGSVAAPIFIQMKDFKLKI